MSLVVYSAGQAVWLYDVTRDSAARLKSGLATDRTQPHFLSAQAISFVDIRDRDPQHQFGFIGRQSVYEITTKNRQVKEIVRVPSDIHSLGWNADKTLLAYEVTAPFTDEAGKQQPFGGTAVCLYDSVRRTTKLIRSLNVTDGRGGSESDEVKLMWSPSGSSILVVDTFQTPQTPSMYVLDRNGRDRLPPMSGTFGRWLDSSTIMFRDLNSGRWFSQEIKSRRLLPLKIPARAGRPEISPDRKLITYDDGDSTRQPSTFVFDLATGANKLLVRGYGAPIWLSRNVIAATAGGPCPPGAECGDHWVSRGKTIGIDVDTGRNHELALPTTGVSVISKVDVLLAKA